MFLNFNHVLYVLNLRSKSTFCFVGISGFSCILFPCFCEPKTFILSFLKALSYLLPSEISPTTKDVFLDFIPYTICVSERSNPFNSILLPISSGPCCDGRFCFLRELLMKLEMEHLMDPPTTSQAII